uniref:Single domain-containing protein n=1 Tax=Homalodisca liturata TaxID=320908 RepID=A0A1B6K767_9HEMI
MIVFFCVIYVAGALGHGHQFIGPSPAVKGAWGQSSPRGGSWSAPSSATNPGAYSAATKGAWGENPGNTGPYPPPWNTAYNKPPPRQGSWGSASLNGPKGTLPYQSSKGPPPRFTPASRNPGIVSAPYPPPASFQTDLNRFGGNQADLRSQKRNKVQSNKCRAGSKVYKVGEKWTPEGSCGRHSCVDGGKISVLGCPNLEGTTDCFLSAEDPRQPWPSCCPQLQCFR